MIQDRSARLNNLLPTPHPASRRPAVRLHASDEQLDGGLATQLRLNIIIMIVQHLLHASLGASHIYRVYSSTHRPGGREGGRGWGWVGGREGRVCAYVDFSYKR